MTAEFLEKIKELLRIVLRAEPDFYRAKYTAAGLDEARIDKLDAASWNSIPVINKEEIARTPYRDRCYGERSGMNKLVFSEETGQYFLIHRTLDEIGREKLPYAGERPMVVMSNVYEAIERCLYFYEKGLLPLIGEFHNSAVIYATARQYDADILFMDRAAVKEFRTGLLEKLPNLKSVTLIDGSFSAEDLDWPRNIQISAVLSIPEIGGIAYACPGSVVAKNLIFHPADDVHIEPSALSVITTTRLYACPVIRYKSALFLEKADSGCDCGKSSFHM